MDPNVHATTCRYVDIEDRKNSHQALAPVPCLSFIDQAIDTVYICSCPLNCIQRQTAAQDVVEVCARNSKHGVKKFVYVSKAKANIFRKLARGLVWR